MSRILHRQAKGRYPKVVSGEGPWLVGEDGRRWLDACGGAAVSCLGHGHPRIVAAIEAQARRLAYAHTSFFSNEPMEELASFLVERAQERGVDGRSKMTKDQLVAALREEYAEAS